MERTALRGRLNWLAAELAEIVPETPTVKSLVFEVPGWPGHLPGQHVDIRLTAEDGYQAQRSYSIATPEDGTRLTLTVEEVNNGEVSPYLIEELAVGDLIELRGPIGGYFVWEPARGGPLQLLGGGSGLVPLMAMIRSQSVESVSIPTRLFISVRSIDEIIYRDELNRLLVDLPELRIDITLTRTQPPDWDGFSRRVDQEMLSGVTFTPELQPMIYVCGPTGFVEAVAASLVELGHRPEHIKTERFGPSGG